VAEAALWGFVGGASLLLGAVIALIRAPSAKLLGFIMAFGAGVLISALAFELTDEAFRLGGADAVAIGLTLGALTYFALNVLLDRAGAERRKSSGGEQADGSPMAILLGAVLDGIPESAAIGLTLLTGEGVSVALVVAVFLSNVPESLAAATGFKAARWSSASILALWAGVAVVSAVSAAVGYAVLDGASENVVGSLQSFAAGAILVMLVDTMIPEAFKEANRSKAVGLATTLGFALAFLLSTVE
jgi:zinc transporter, ZIP family